VADNAADAGIVCGGNPVGPASWNYAGWAA
jgi:hypothetical protein